MTLFFTIFLVLILSSSSYAAGRLHGHLSYRLGYRHGYRQGYFDGDRGSWNRRRREARAVAAAVQGDPRSALNEPTAQIGSGTTYLSASFAGAATDGGRHSAGLRQVASPAAG